MPDAVTHPTLHELIAFGLGKLPESAVAAIAAHLESCPACRQAAASVTPDSFLGKVRDAGLGGSSFPPYPPRPADAPSSAGRSAAPASLCPNLPPELASHPKYLILRELGRGGMGVVYQARHKEMDRQVVIKVINRKLLARPDALERFHREIKAAARLSHPNIVTAYDAERIGDTHMLVMEFVPGQSLAEVVQKRGPLPIEFACHFARQVALGLQHAHERGLVHRDIKPQNLILTLKNQVKILDFGLAKMVREEANVTGLTAHDSCMGTPDYCAPEQALNARSADTRADLYSLGCTLYYLLSGRPPFREDSVVNTFLAHQQKQPLPLPELRADVPAALWQVVARLLAKEPGQRYQKPIEVVQALAPFVKAGAKPNTQSGPMPLVVTPDKGTVIAADTHQIQKLLRDVPGKTPPRQVPAKDKVSPFAELRGAAEAATEAEHESKVAKRSPAAWWKRPGVLATAISVSLALVLMAVITIKVKEQLPNGDKRKVRPSDFEADTRAIEPQAGQALTIKIPLKPKAKVGFNPPKEAPEGSGKSAKPSNLQVRERPAPDTDNLEGKKMRPRVAMGEEGDAQAHCNLGTELLNKGDMDGAIVELSRAIQLKNDIHQAHCNLGLALLKKRDADGAIAQLRRAIELKKDCPTAHCNLGFALRHQGRFAEALDAMKRGNELGRKNPSWKSTSSRWFQDTERMAQLVERLPGVLKGEDPPSEPSERLLLAEICRVNKRLYGWAARLAEGAFKDKPSLAEDLTTENRYHAACAAARAGCGKGEDARELDEKERARWRQQALAWLRADLELRRKQLGGADANTTREVRSNLRHWQQEPDLAGVRDDQAVAELPEAEHQDWRKLWEEVRRVREPAFVPLFNGTDLAGWKASDNSAWQVVEGVIEGAKPTPGPISLWTTRTFANFHLSVETTIAEGNCSYIQFRQGKTGFYIVHIDGTTPSPGDHTGDLGFSTRGLTHPTSLAPANPVVPLRPGEWFTVEIIAKGAKLTVLMKGKVVATFEDPQRRFSSGVINLVCRGNSMVHFRKVEIKEFD